MFKIATGALGWPPDVANTAEVHEIILAYEGLIDWHKALNPPPDKARSSKTPKTPGPSEGRTATGRAKVASGLGAALRSRKAKG